MVGTGSTGTNIPKWPLVLALGTTGVLGLGYWYLKNSAQCEKRKNFKSKSLSLDSADEKTGPPIKNESPIQKAQRFKTEGNVLFKAGKYDEAIALYNKAIESCPLDMKIDLATFYQNRAAAYENLKKWSSVKEDCTTALELNPKYIKALHRRARAYETAKDLVKALGDITAVCIMEKFQNQASLLMADRVLRDLGRQHAKEAMQNRKPVMPSKYFINAYFSSFSEDPINKAAKDKSAVDMRLKGFDKALNALQQQHYEDVIPACTEEVDSSESEAQHKNEARLLRATFCLLMGRHAEALADLETLINNSDVDTKVRVNALIKQAALNMQLENSEESMENFKKAIELEPQISDIYHHRAQYHLLLGNTTKAAEDFRKAVQLNPNFAIACVQKCYTDYRQAVNEMDIEKLTKVMDEFQDLIKKFPTCSECYSLYAQVLTDQHKYEEADKFYQKTIDFDPDNATVYVQRAVLQIQWNSDIEKSVQLINEALSKDPKCEYAYEALGSIEVQRGNLKHAIELFEEALKLAKTEAEMTHLFSLKDAAQAQLQVAATMGLDLASFVKNATS